MTPGRQLKRVEFLGRIHRQEDGEYVIQISHKDQVEIEINENELVPVHVTVTEINFPKDLMEKEKSSESAAS